jgi:hypothetical protein
VGQFENLLVEGEAIAVRFYDAVADALRAGILESVGVSKPVGASIQACCAATAPTLAAHNIKTTHQYFPVIAMAAAPETSANRDHDRVDRGEQLHIPRNLLRRRNLHERSGADISCGRGASSSLVLLSTISGRFV